MNRPHVMILAGEASGDAHAAEFVEQLKLYRPDIHVSGMGGREMRRAGVEVFFDSSVIAVVGLVEVLRHWGDIKRAMTIVRGKLEQTRPDLLVLVDYPEFNLKMARRARELGIKVLFYISPQVWAWRPGRIHKIGGLIDHMAVIFKFEQRYYDDAGIAVSFVGHPLVDKVKADVDAGAIRERLGIGAEDRVVGLFPGSRRSEVSRLLPVLFDTAKAMHERDPGIRFILPVASTLNFDEIALQCTGSGSEIIASQDDIYEVISSCDAIATCSGTVTLEIALLGVPMCILYKMSSLSYLIMSRLITIPHIGLANIVAGKAVVREFLQRDANPDSVGRELFRLLDDREYRQRVRQGLGQVRENLGAGDGAANMAKLVLSMIGQTSQNDERGTTNG
ncbi:MAG: lipid-A-disaccharide synthase [Gammaproteobacteria bacterium]|nr:lipid-A-disaccharide synthase [Gammaproteobacteria bacterium]MDH3449933.1 lipid-A-disaccharide synthase [Gammaproteobacteria bacterium]